MFGSLREFRKFKKLSQEDFGRELGLGEKWRNYPNWETGRSPMPLEIKAKITKMKYDGPFPEPGGDITRDDLEALRQDLRAHQAWAMEEIRKGQVALAAALQEVLKRIPAP